MPRWRNWRRYSRSLARSLTSRRALGQERAELVNLGGVERHLLVGEAAELSELHLDLGLLALQAEHHGHGLDGGAGCGEALLLDLGT